MVKKTKIFKFYEEVKQEGLKVVWPEKKELITSVIVVLIAVFLFISSQCTMGLILLAVIGSQCKI